MEKLNKTNKGICVKRAPKLLFGEGLMLNDLKNKAGLGCGSKKVIALDNYVISPDTAILSLNRSRAIGLTDCLMNQQIMLATNT